tara:strand:+ start:79269 stop:79727 length:459 start_codon:yes stop_codon:yes gene_type:complete
MHKPKIFYFPFRIFEDYDLKNVLKRISLKKNTQFSKETLSHNNFTIIMKGIVILYWKDNNNNSIIIDFKTVGQVLRPGIEINEDITGKIYAIAHTDVEIISLDAKFMCACAIENNAISDFFYSGLTNDLNSTYRQLKLLKVSETLSHKVCKL